MKNGKRASSVVRDKHLLYTAAVQSPESDLDFFKRVYKRRNGKPFRRLKEDFCGTAAMACEWVLRNPQNRAWGVDLDRPTLEWSRKRYLPRLGDAAERLELIEGNVLSVTEPVVDVVAALNFSYQVFQTRDLLRSYFEAVRGSLAPGGILVLDALGGQETMGEMVEKRKIPRSKAFDGTQVSAFTYVWEQARFNPVDHQFVCKIHFKLADGTKLRQAFRYDWRLWTLPEIRELLSEAGFADVDVYVEGWDEEADDTDGVFRRRKRFENQESWIAYVVGVS